MRLNQLTASLVTLCFLVQFAFAAPQEEEIRRLVLQSGGPMDFADTNGWVNSAAAYKTLVSIGTDAIPYLTEIAQNKDERGRARAIAVTALGDIPSEHTVTVLKKLLVSDEPQGIKERALIALARYGSAEAVSLLLLEAIRPDAQPYCDAVFHATVLSAIASVTNPTAVAILARSATNERQSVAEVSQQGLARIETKESLEALLACLADPRPGIRGSIAELLGKVRQSTVQEALKAALAKERDDGVRVEMAISITRHDPTNGPAVKLLRDYASSTTDINIRCKALVGLSQTGDQSNKRFLRQFLYDSDPAIRLTAIDAFAKVAGASELGVLEEIGKHDELDMVREHAKKMAVELEHRLSARPKGVRHQLIK